MKRILVAEDEDVIRDFVVINLRRNGYEVVDVPNGDEAIRVFDENNGDFDICLLDIMMPGKDGFTVCKEIRKRSSTVGIIMLSAKSQEMDKVGALMFGADDYVTKPFGPAELIARVDTLHLLHHFSPDKPLCSLRTRPYRKSSHYCRYPAFQRSLCVPKPPPADGASTTRTALPSAHLPS